MSKLIDLPYVIAKEAKFEGITSADAYHRYIQAYKREIGTRVDLSGKAIDLNAIDFKQIYSEVA